MDLNLEYIADKIGEDYKICDNLKKTKGRFSNNICPKCTYQNSCKKWTQGNCIFINTQTGTGKTFFILNKLIKYIVEENAKPLEANEKIHCFNNSQCNPTTMHKKILILNSRASFKKQFKVDLLNMYHDQIFDYLKENAYYYEYAYYLYQDFNEYDAEQFAKETIYSFINNDKGYLGYITVKTYQSLSDFAFSNQKKLYTYLSNFDYIVLDEYHCIVEDSTFDNEYLFIFNSLIRKSFSKAIRIFISATPNNHVKYYFSDDKGNYNNNCIVYDDKRNYNYLNIKYFSKDETMLNFIKDYYKYTIHKNDKWVFFVSSKKKAKDFYNILKKSKINVSLAMRGLQNKEIKNIVENSRFNANVLISTKLLDNGINLKDKNIKNLVIMEVDKTTFLQEIGRIRVDIKNARTINLYIHTRNKRLFSTLNSSNEKIQKTLDFYNNNKYYNNSFDLRYATKFNKLPYQLFYINPYTGKWCVNELSENRFHDIKFFIKSINDSFFNSINILFHLKKIEINLSWLNLENISKNFNLFYNNFNEYIFEDIIKFRNNIEINAKESKFLFLKTQLSWLGLENTFKISNFLNYESYFNNIKYFLIKNVKRELDKEKKMELSKLIIDFENLTNSKTCKSKNLQVETINKFFEKHNLFYEIELKKSSQRVKSKKNPVTKRYRKINFAYWKIYTCKNTSNNRL